MQIHWYCDKCGSPQIKKPALVFNTKIILECVFCQSGFEMVLTPLELIKVDKTA